jgi:AraC-like DNA-binding protein
MHGLNPSASVKLAGKVGDRMKDSQLLQENFQNARMMRRGSMSRKKISETICAHVMANLSDSKFSVMQLANILFMNEDYLTRVFKREMGISIKKYIINERMAYARTLLETKSVSVAEVAEQVGYSSYSYFVAAFSKHFGCTPTSVRRGAKTGGQLKPAAALN